MSDQSALLMVLVLAGCAADKPRESSDFSLQSSAEDRRLETGDSSPARTDARRPATPEIHSEVGALDRDAVEAAFRAARPTMDACLKNGRKRLPVLDGELEAVVRVGSDGAVRYSYPRDSTLGDRATERCVLDALAKQSWPKPHGGDEGEASQKVRYDTEDRPAIDWTVGDLGKAGSELAKALSACAKGRATLTLTLYVDSSGKALSAGASSSDENGRDALDCATSAATKRRYPSPGSWPAKVVLQAR